MVTFLKWSQNLSVLKLDIDAITLPPLENIYDSTKVIPKYFTSHTDLIQTCQRPQSNRPSYNVLIPITI